MLVVPHCSSLLAMVGGGSVRRLKSRRSGFLAPDEDIITFFSTEKYNPLRAHLIAQRWAPSRSAERCCETVEQFLLIEYKMVSFAKIEHLSDKIVGEIIDIHEGHRQQQQQQ